MAIFEVVVFFSIFGFVFYVSLTFMTFVLFRLMTLFDLLLLAGDLLATACLKSENFF